jgi:hypothetical protein
MAEGAPAPALAPVKLALPAEVAAAEEAAGDEGTRAVDMACIDDVGRTWAEVGRSGIDGDSSDDDEDDSGDGDVATATAAAAAAAATAATVVAAVATDGAALAKAENVNAAPCCGLSNCELGGA